MLISFSKIVILAIAFASIGVAQSSPFLDYVKQRLGSEPSEKGRARLAFDSVCSIEKDPLARRVFFEYGSMFVSSMTVRLPKACIFSSPGDVDAFQIGLETTSDRFGGVEIELQAEPMRQLLNARTEAASRGLTITPLDGSIAGRRSYADTVRIWNSRFYRALDHWTRKGRITREESATAAAANVEKQVEMVVAWEAKGLYFSTDLTKSIFHSVAPPGTSQHLSLLAFDVVEAGNPRIRQIMNKFGWFQTIRTDQPHFTYLGVTENELPSRGLQMISHRGNFYWVPKID